MNIETIEIPLEEYRMLLRESRFSIIEKLNNAFDSLEVKGLDDKLLYLSTIMEYRREYQLVLDKLDQHEVKFTDSLL